MKAQVNARVLLPPTAACISPYGIGLASKDQVLVIKA
jgi:hypothetical protein